MALVFSKGAKVGEVPLFTSTQYLRMLLADVTGDGLRWGDLSALEKAEVISELNARASGERLVNTGRGTVYYVDANSGSNSNSGLTAADPFLTMAKAFTSIASGDTIRFRGKIKEQLVTPVQVFDVTVIGEGNRPRHADSTPAGGELASSTWSVPAVDAGTPLCKVLQQGWRFVNILWVGPAASDCIQLFRDAGAGNAERDASHAEIIGCRFASGYNAINDPQGCYGVLVANNRFVSQTNFAIIGNGGIGAGQGAWRILDNEFDSNTNHVKIAGIAAVVRGNCFDAGGNPNTTVVLNVDNGGGGARNFVVGNYFLGTTANFNTPDVVGTATDLWTQNSAIDTVAPGTSGVYETGRPA